MKIIGLMIFLICFLLILPGIALAEVKQPGFGTSIGIIPKLPKTPNDPVLSNGHVYPNWGPLQGRLSAVMIYASQAWGKLKKIVSVIAQEEINSYRLLSYSVLPVNKASIIS